jgi:hypothetical protein
VHYTTDTNHYVTTYLKETQQSTYDDKKSHESGNRASYRKVIFIDWTMFHYKMVCSEISELLTEVTGVSAHVDPSVLLLTAQLLFSSNISRRLEAKRCVLLSRYADSNSLKSFTG